MTLAIGRRLPAVKSLSSILPTGTEGGKEFARILGLLLFHEAKRVGTDFSLFDDASGDFEGLDGYIREKKSKEITGFQYKFFPSPLKDSHRSEIVKSLRNAMQRSDKLTLKKWIIITPDDLKNSATRRNGGDVSWFEDLRTAHPEVVIEHYGHSKIISLFLQTHYLCLYYYPSLISSGERSQKSIKALRTQYDENMRKKFGRIEFVGMSVYKDETSRRIPLEDIYIPLSLVPERSGEESEDTPRIDPYSLLKPGAKNVILGDPGSGKSTLIGFLALAGISKALQMRCETSEDPRLTIVVTLRRYADELKNRKNLPILDYIMEVAQADFNMQGLSESFFSFYIESGQAVLLFDGLDELPSKEFKSIIRQRIDSFASSFPTNTVIVTSRLIGYEAETRFDDTYGHFRVAKLKVPEIEKFIYDWYSARIDDTIEKSRNSADLIKIIKHPDSDSIRELARNPLLLTIVALVHRIDAVLPDQRVVLYQKCTETLLNTWYSAKRQDEETAKGRIERRNRLRIEAIAYWMHRRSLKGKARSVAPRAELIQFLAQYISDNETIRDLDDLAEDQAETFVDFIRNAAGLLIEAGDGLYSFIHLTFQEYLCATHLASFGEKDGAPSIWRELKGDLQNPRWREVVRLLVASLRSTQAQKYFVEKLLEDGPTKQSHDNCLLLLGLLRDAIEPAENSAEDIIENCLSTLILLNKRNDASAVLYSVLHWLIRDVKNGEIISTAWMKLYESAEPINRIPLLLANTALVFPTPLSSFKDQFELPDSAEKYLCDFLIDGQTSLKTEEISKRLDTVATYWAFHSPGTNAEAALLLGCSLALNPKGVAKRLLQKELALVINYGSGPHGDNGINMVGIASHSTTDISEEILQSFINSVNPERQIIQRPSELLECVDKFVAIHPELKLSSSRRGLEGAAIFKKAAKLAGVPDKALRNLHDRDNSSSVGVIHEECFLKHHEAPKTYWSLLRSSEVFNVNFLRTFENCSQIKIDGMWAEALHIGLSESIPNSISKFFSESEREKVQSNLLRGHLDEDTVCFSAWMILFDIWRWEALDYENTRNSKIDHFIEQITKTSAFEIPEIKLAIFIHRIATKSDKESEIELLKLWTNNNQIGDMLSEAGWTAPKPTRKTGKSKKSRTP
ncbi:NACHT domain-containing protein [Pseudomonas sp. B21-044]|uniref:NACHT domain-containing protein n=1 Tax=Pseudomonas sp. B21-044 TaxID=2895488 RepID=UPI00215FE0A6|nr:NACHT domain-containing protein [Pseudomonas sp. B21-044]UVL17663.1 NACHT domain-containing protein [Pseudomonas sp. B21-044]